MKMRRFWLIIIGLISISTFAQRPIGTWKAHFPYTNAYQVQDAGDRIYCSSSLSIFYVLKSDNSIHTIDKASGLSDVSVTKLVYNEATKTLVIAYENSNIDLLVNGETIYNLPELKNKITTSSKTINGLYSYGSNVYISSDLGLSVLNLTTREIKSTFVIGNGGAAVVVNNACVANNKIFAATNQGVKAANLNSANLQDFNNWINQSNGLSTSPSVFSACVNNTVFATQGDSLFRFDGTNWSLVYEENSWQVKQIKVTAGKLWVSVWNDTLGFSSKWLVVDETGNYTSQTFAGNNRPLDITSSNEYWVADLWSGLLRYSSMSSTPVPFVPNGPLSNGVFNMSIYDDVLYMAAGGITADYIVPNNNRDGVILFKEGEWRYFNGFNGYGQLFNTIDNLSVAVSKTTNKVYWGSWGGGLTQYDISTGAIAVFDYTNSPLEKLGTDKTYVSALTADRNGNVWMMNTGASEQLKIFKTDGTWLTFSVPYSIRSTRKMYVDTRGWMWMCQRDGDVIVYNPGNDFDSPSDDQYARLGVGTGNGGLPNNSVWCIAEDKDNDIWVGTDEGIGTFFCAGSVFSTNRCDADRIKVERDGFIGYLFSTETVKALEVDGGNRKWVGTQNGLYLVSADGKTEIKNFTSENSPLPSNSITDIKINENTGEVFIGTEQGLVSYQSDAIKGGEKKGEALVYPNPVLPNYTGPIAIKGLVDDAYVKITDAAGVLVFQGKALGGQMIWDGKGYNGTRVNSGVYIVYSATDAGKEKSVAKIVLVN